MIRCRLVSAGIVAIASVVFSQMASGDDVVINTSASRLWSTVTNSSVVLPVPWPQGAVTATLVVPAVGIFAGVEANLTKGVDSSYTLALPRPTGPENEYVVSPRIDFRNADGETLAPVLKASFGVVCGSAFFRGTDCTASSWGDIKKGCWVLPKCSGEKSYRVIYESSVATNTIPEDCAWISFSPRKSGTHSLSTYGKDGELLFSAMLNVLPDGLVFTLR
ncbi:MAG: hypothetical protein IJV91_03605 [Kiritimatiellae bacterium]|nr:hypothetical protein [Kiritimatiellia bacterium]